VLVTVGGVPPGQETEAGHMIGYVVPLPVVINTKLPALFSDGAPLIVIVVIAPFIATSNTFPLFKFNVKLPADILGLVYFS